ncbi:MAG: zf-HC2 domain-containing protein [Ilumatobacteraceae bacterium]
MSDGRDDERVGAVGGEAGGDRRPDAHVDVVALALGDVDGRRRAEMAAHLLVCAACRSDYDDVAATVGDVLPAVPAVQPPIGFDEQVLERMGVAPASTRPSPGPLARGASGRHRWAWLAGAAALVAVAVGTIVWRAGGDEGPAAGDVRTLEKVDGEAVGTVSIGEVAGEPVMVVAIVGAPDGVSYYCRTRLVDGTVVDSESWPSGNGAWVVPLPTGNTSDVDSVELVVSGTDHVWSTASFGTA